MRCELSGYGGPLLPLVLTLEDGVPFLKEEYVDLGYTNYDVICIGAAGGRGGGVDYLLVVPDPSNPGEFLEYTETNTYGGGGGGGGLHRVQGILNNLPSSCEVVVGEAGEDGIIITDPEDSPPPSGGAGGVSSFNGTTCQASGGGGGETGFIAPLPYFAGGRGGGGGVGNSAIAGLIDNGGNRDPDEPIEEPFTYTVTSSEDGTWDEVIGEGGGGGVGGMEVKEFGIRTDYEAPNNGSRGSYSGSDPSVYGPAGIIIEDGIEPGFGGGAKASPINQESTVYGSRVSDGSGNGVVIICLTQV